MAAVTAGVIGVVTAGAGVYQAVKGAEQRKEAKEAMENYKVPDLINTAEGIQVATMGAELQKQMLGSSINTAMETLQASGIRGAIGGTQQLVGEQKLQAAQIGAGLDEKIAQRSAMIAQENANLRGMREQRYQQDIAALSSQYNAGNQMFYSGLQSGIQGLASGAQSAGNFLMTEKYIDALSKKNA
jgi:hypothetical protein